jgi:hypothetical protein
MSKLEVNAVEPQCGTNLTLGASGDTIIIPSGATISNQGTAAGFGPTGAVSWNTTKITADPNPAVTGVGYFADTTSAAFTITLPSSPSAGAVVGIADYANTFATNNVTVDRNGSNIGGVADNAFLFTNGVSVTFVYVDATQGWIVTDSGNRSDLPAPDYVAATGGTVTCCGDYKIHTFTGPGTFTVTSVGNPGGSTTVDYLVVAGGGGAGNSNGGGGGAGGFRESSGTASGCYSASPLGSGVSALPVSVQGYPITVGSGGAGQPGPEPQASGKGVSGSPSVFSTITSTGGGGGGSGNCTGPGNNAATGGSGGGGGTNNGSLGAGNTPPTSPSQGNSGSNGAGPGSGIPYQGGGGGGGASAVGVTITPSPQKAGDGGAGATSSINATPTARAGGGGGGASPGTTAGSGGSGGGGAGNISGTGTAGTVNTGGGGGGGSGPGPGGWRFRNSYYKVQISKLKYDKYN